MKIKATEGMGVTAARASQPFQKLLDEARGLMPKAGPMQKPLPSLVTRGTALPPPLRVGELARVRVHAEAQRLEQVRGTHDATAHEAQRARAAAGTQERERATERVVDLICRDLMSEPPAPAVPTRTPAVTHSFPPVPTPTRNDSGVERSRTAEQAVALIEKIEVFVKSHRPALALTLNNSLGAQVEIERLGPQEVALKLISRQGPPSPGTLSRIRDELRARGLRVAALSVA